MDSLRLVRTFSIIRSRMGRISMNFPHSPELAGASARHHPAASRGLCEGASGVSLMHPPPLPPGRRPRAAGLAAAAACRRRAGTRRQGPEIPPRPRHLQHRRQLGPAHPPQGVQDRRRFAGRAAHHAQARRRAVPEQGRAQGSPQDASPTPAWTSGAAAPSASSSPRTPAVVKKNIETCKQFVELVADLGGKGREGAAQWPAQRRAGREDAGADRQGAVPCGKAAEDAGVEIWVEVHGNGTAHPPHMKTIMEHVRPPEGRPDLELQPAGRRRTARWRSISSCCGRGSARATSTNCTRTRPASIPTANCSACSANTATTA